MENYDIELRKDEFKWQKMKFLIMIALIGLFAFIALYWMLLNQNRSYEIGQESLYIQDKVKIEIMDSRIRQEELSQKVRELELRNRNLEDYSKSLKESFDTTQELLQVLKKDIEQLKEK